MLFSKENEYFLKYAGLIADLNVEIYTDGLISSFNFEMKQVLLFSFITLLP